MVVIKVNRLIKIKFSVYLTSKLVKYYLENFKKKITNLAKYYEELNKKFNFTDISREELLGKLRENREKHMEEILTKKHFLSKSILFSK